MNYPLRRRKPRPMTENMFKKVDVYIPNSVYDIVYAASQEKDMPVSRLIACALDNELDSPKPFNYPCDLPTDEYKEYLYAKEAGKLLQWLKQVPTGANIESIVLSRRGFGLHTRAEVLYALRELFEQDMIEEFIPKKNSRGYVVRKKRIRIKQGPRQHPYPNSVRDEEKEDEY